ncbi:oligosaccharide flippase family protein [Coraliomargarita algicola]|uniref:Oligosaccharide flippase family protein n=1 Tax=Coraliomargarita algicola TaxID=3092156 RepID=A0ABZ0RIB8_9BACT|nr:oligosaccharide flippase family protein [Coraliomargarita sp. J2-16]WPJ94989.1 oligosaccharide flippase family protein [Coraliomargarita sp. J2-16]
MDALCVQARRPFLRHIATLVSGSALAQLIGLACAPVLTRLYTPEEFGLLGVFMAVVAVSITIATLRYDLVVVLPKEDASAWSLLRLVGCWTLLAVLVAFVVLFPIRNRVAEALGTVGFAHYFVCLPLLVLVGGWLSLATHWAIRKKSFHALSTTSVASSVFGNSYKIGFGWLGFGGGVLIVGSLIQQVMHLLVLGFQLRKGIPKGEYNSDAAWKLVKEHRSFPYFRMPQDALNAFTIQLPNLILAAYYSPVIVGFYLLAQRVLQAPIGVVRESVRSVMYQRIAEAYNQGENLYLICLKATLSMATLIMPVVVLFSLIGPHLFHLIFGAEWEVAGVYARWLILWAAVSFCNVPAVVAVPIVGLNQFLLKFEIISTLARSVALIFAVRMFSAEIAIAVLALVACVGNIMLILMVFSRIRRGVAA